MNRYDLIAQALQLQEYERKEIALALIASTLNPMSAVDALEAGLKEDEND